MKENALRVFCCYAHEDEDFLLLLKKYLALLIRQEQIIFWHDREILPGEHWEEQIAMQLEQADIILLLLSPAFFASDYCWGKEMQQALERQRKGEVQLIPILLKPTPGWEATPLVYLQALPTDVKPVTTWRSRAKALENITGGINLVLQNWKKYTSQIVQSYTICFLHEEALREEDLLERGIFKSTRVTTKDEQGLTAAYENDILPRLRQWSETLFSTIDGSIQEIPRITNKWQWRLTTQHEDCRISMDLYPNYTIVWKPSHITPEMDPAYPGDCIWQHTIQITGRRDSFIDLFVEALHSPYWCLEWVLSEPLDLRALSMLTERRHDLRDPSWMTCSLGKYQDDTITVELYSEPDEPAKISLQYEPSSPSQHSSSGGFYRAHRVFSVQRIFAFLYGRLSLKEEKRIIEIACTASE